MEVLRQEKRGLTPDRSNDLFQLMRSNWMSGLLQLEIPIGEAAPMPVQFKGMPCWERRATLTDAMLGNKGRAAAHWPSGFPPCVPPVNKTKVKTGHGMPGSSSRPSKNTRYQLSGSDETHWVRGGLVRLYMH